MDEVTDTRIDHKQMKTKAYQKMVQETISRMTQPTLADWHNLSWKEFRTKNAPAPRQLHSSVQYNDCMYIYGGFGAKPKQTFFHDLLSFDFARQNWTLVVDSDTKNQPPGRHSHCAVVYQNSMWVFGGISDGKQMDDLWYFDFPRNAWFSVPSTPKNWPASRWGHTAVVYGDEMYMFGGFTNSYSNELWRFSFKKQKWSLVEAKGDVPLPRQFHSAVTYENSMFVYGGYNGNDFSNFYEYLFLKKKWIKLQDSQENEGRRGHTAVVTGQWLAIHAGRDRHTCRNDVIVYSFKRKKWDKNLPDAGSCSPRYFHSLCVWRGILVIFGGLGFDPKTGVKKPVDLCDLYLLGTDTSISLATMIERVDDSSMSEVDQTKRPEPQKAKVIKAPKKTIQTKDDAKAARFIRRHGLIGTLPRDVKLCIAGYLPWESLVAVGSVNKEWYLIGLTEAHWEAHFVTVYMNRTRPPNQSYWNPRKGNETADQKLYADYKTRYEVWKVSLSSNKTYWKEICSAHFPRGEDGILWIPPDRPTSKDLEAGYTSPPAGPYRLIMLGAGGVGKSCATIRYVQNHFVPEYDPTIEDSYRKQVKILGQTCVLDILDTAGPEEFSSMRDQYMRVGEGFVLCYDVTERRSFEEVDIFVAQILRIKDADRVPIILVGCKCDSWDRREVQRKEGIEKAKSFNIPFVETSALTGAFIEETFTRIVEDCIYHNQLGSEGGVVRFQVEKREEKCCVQ